MSTFTSTVQASCIIFFMGVFLIVQFMAKLDKKELAIKDTTLTPTINVYETVEAYKTELISLLSTYQQLIEDMQEITMSPRVYTVLDNKNLFDAEFLPIIKDVQITQAKMEELTPPPDFYDLHVKLIDMFSRFSHAMTLFEEWNNNRDDIALLNQASEEVGLFSQELDSNGSISNLILKINKP